VVEHTRWLFSFQPNHLWDDQLPYDGSRMFHAMPQSRETKSFFKVGASKDASGFLLTSEGMLTASYPRPLTQLLDPLV
jgi:hypothetical protein